MTVEVPFISLQLYGAKPPHLSDREQRKLACTCVHAALGHEPPFSVTIKPHRRKISYNGTTFAGVRLGNRETNIVRIATMDRKGRLDAIMLRSKVQAVLEDAAKARSLREDDFTIKEAMKRKSNLIT